MKAIMVSVDYADILAITLPYNRHHFDEVMVVTHYEDVETQKIAQENKCHLWMTNAFYEDGATFNKWKALEQGLDMLGRKGWLCIMDADVLWPKDIGFSMHADANGVEVISGNFHPTRGFLYTPFRRMWEEWPRSDAQFRRDVREKAEALGLDTSESWFAGDIPPENRWPIAFPLHRQQQEFAGYSQIFHADDPHLGPAPWHEIDWKHAGGADSFFQMKWPDNCKVRPPFEVLHLGPAGQNWFGRATPLANGTLLEGSEERRKMSGKLIWEQRFHNQQMGRDRFAGEKIGKE